MYIYATILRIISKPALYFADNSNAKDKQVSSLLEHFEFRHADYGQETFSKIEYHLNQVDKLLVPTETTKMALMSLYHEDTSSSDIEGSSSLWSTLTNVLGMSEEQKASIMEKKIKFHEIWSLIHHSSSLANDLREMMKAKNDALNSEIKKVKGILSPSQVAKVFCFLFRVCIFLPYLKHLAIILKFVLWVTENAACIYMLNRVLAEKNGPTSKCE
jgi:hypothetical protein